MGQLKAVAAMLVLLPFGKCPAGPNRERDTVQSRRSEPSSKPTSPNPDGPIRIEMLEPAASPPTFVMRGGPRGPALLVFLHGMCGHGLGYVQAFQFNAAKQGTLIAPQGDVSCGGVFSKWSMDVVALDARISATFQALGVPDPAAEVTVLGMSQGASRAVALAQRFPKRYTRLVSMDAPGALKPGQLRALRAAVMMAGERDRQDLMRESQRALMATGVPAVFMLIPQATHGAMGPTPEQTMGAALEWLFSHSKP